MFTHWRADSPIYIAMYTSLCVVPMATKNLAVREEVYRKLVDAKNSGESFSDVIERILENRASLFSFSGVLADSKGLTEIEKEARRIRKTARART